MLNRKLSWVFALVAALCLAAYSSAQEKNAEKSAAVAEEKAEKKKEADDKPEEKSKPETHEVKTSPFKIEVEVDGVFESAEMTEVSLRPKVWSGLVVEKAVDEGVRVKKGDVLVELETEKIDEQIRDMKYSRELAALTFQQTSDDLRFFEETVPLDLAAAERSKKIANEELTYYQEIDRPMSEKFAHFSLESSKARLENAQEELNQLEQMYKADDLTEETEEIVLKRARRSVKDAEFFVESAEERFNYTINKRLPRMDDQIKDQTRRQNIEAEKTAVAMPLLLNKKRIELQKQTFSRQQSEEKFARIQQDRKLMTVRAPTAGIVYYGKCVRGKWTTAATYRAQLNRGGSLSSNQVFMTIVRPQPMFVRIDLPEKELHHVRSGVAGTATPTAFPKAKLPVKVDEISPIPISAGTFDARVSVKLDDQTAGIVPGMQCTIKLLTYEKKDAITVPASTVFAEEDDEDQRYVYLATDDGKHEKRTVKVGKKSGDKLEIVGGLQVGDKILLKKPEDDDE